MKKTHIILSLEEARILALKSQGLIQPCFGKGQAGTLAAINHIGYVQIDTLSVAARAHHHTLWTRVPDYKEEFLNQLLEKDKSIFEYWSHAASYLPMSDYRFSLRTKKIIAVLCIPFIFLNQLMAYQYSHLIMDSGNMEKHRYWDIFLKTDLTTINNDRIQSILKNNTVFKTDSMTFENTEVSQGLANSGFQSNRASVVGENNEYSPAFMFSAKELGLEYSQPFYVIAECMTKTNCEGSHLNLVVSVFQDANCSKWDVVFHTQFKKDKNGWIRMIHVVRMKQYEMNEKNVIKIFAMNYKGYSLVDNLKYCIVKYSDIND